MSIPISMLRRGSGLKKTRAKTTKVIPSANPKSHALNNPDGLPLTPCRQNVLDGAQLICYFSRITMQQCLCNGTIKPICCKNNLDGNRMVHGRYEGKERENMRQQPTKTPHK